VCRCGPSWFDSLSLVGGDITDLLENGELAVAAGNDTRTIGEKDKARWDARKAMVRDLPIMITQYRVWYRVAG